jgi:hypothetical protein
MSHDWIFPHEAALILGVAPSTVVYMERTGKLPAAARIGSHRIRVFERGAVEKLAAERQAARDARSADPAHAA